MNVLRQLIMPAIIAVTASGCFSTSPKPALNWLIEPDDGFRASALTVAAPYDDSRMVVMRPGGLVAFDAYNVFAARPLAMIATAAPFERNAPKVHIRRLALDCRVQGQRSALVELQLSNANETVSGHGAVSAIDGNYSFAFSEALKFAYEDALRKFH